MKKKIGIPVLLLVMAVVFIGCGKKTYQDGTYKAHIDAGDMPKEEFDEDKDDEPSGSMVLGKADIIIEIKNGKITDCQYKAWDAMGHPKDETYGQDKSEHNQKKAQKAAKGLQAYCRQLVDKQDVGDVDVVTGATISYDEFVDVAKKALEKATK